jgi:hypothetical protein
VQQGGPFEIPGGYCFLRHERQAALPKRLHAVTFALLPVIFSPLRQKKRKKRQSYVENPLRIAG